jgi:quercetin dioxygenase-like cupin family protein
MSKYFPTSDECGHHTIFPGVTIATCSCEKMMLSLVELAPHSVVEEHAHPHEQVGILLAGKVLFYIGDEQKTLHPGDMWRIPGNTRHRVVVLEEPTRALDVFCPVREEYR